MRMKKLVGILIGALAVFSPRVSRGGIAPSEGVQFTPLQIALKFVEFQTADGSPVLSESGAKQLTRRVNRIYSTCKIQFNLEKYETVNPHDFGLAIVPKSLDEMTEFRKPFDDPHYLTIVKTGKWNHEVIGKPNAWTAMPGDSPSGVVIESPVTSFAGIVAHELGHYLDLYHVDNARNVMNAMIYDDSTEWSTHQCEKMRATAQHSWVQAILNYGN